jgi:hypothetical protein
MTPADFPVEDVVLELERYIAMHPTAADTADGIAQWWLDGRKTDPGTIETALEILVRRAVLQRTAQPGGRSTYRRAGSCV